MNLTGARSRVFACPPRGITFVPILPAVCMAADDAVISSPLWRPCGRHARYTSLRVLGEVAAVLYTRSVLLRAALVLRWGVDLYA